MTPALFLRMAALAAAAVVLALALASPMQPRTTYAALNCDVPDASIDTEEQAFLGLINSYRAQVGAQALVITGPLTRAATWQSNDQAAKNYYGHTDSLGRDAFLRMSECDVPGWDSSAENVAAGTQTAQAAFNLWRGSPGHDTNMVNPGYRGIGIARAFRQGTTYGWYWTTTFSTDASGGGAPAGGPAAQTLPPAPPAPAAPPAPPPGCTGVSVASNQGATIAPNTAVLLTASPTCPGAPSLQWWGAFVFPNGGQIWQQLTGYNAPRTFTWTPTAPGNYLLGVWAKIDGTSPAGGFDTSTMISISVVAANTGACTAPTLAPASGGTLTVRQTVRFTANATCGGAGQYQFWGAYVFPDGSQSWQPLTAYGASKTYDWTPTAPGNYIIGFWAKNDTGTPANGQFDISLTSSFSVR